MNLDSIETTTFHDQAPSHPAVPGAVLKARHKMNTAWHLHQIACDNLEAGVGSPLAVSILLEAATAAQQEYRAAWDRANAGCPEGNCPA